MAVINDTLWLSWKHANTLCKAMMFPVCSSAGHDLNHNLSLIFVNNSIKYLSAPYIGFSVLEAGLLCFQDNTENKVKLVSLHAMLTGGTPVPNHLKP